MKSKFTLLLILLMAGTIQAQIRKIPAAVTDAFKARYPHAEKVAWKDEITSFEAQFILNGFKMTADFNSKGEWQNSEKKMKFSELPAAVIDGFKKSKYADWETTSVVEIDKNSESLQYRIEVKKSAVHKKYLFFNTNGKLLRDAVTI
ncbi:MAG TPA: PepSY-like domain-containing protein [Chitinophagaceae bacterium]|nr:PepSY-like domain-containing protein [Chitinophagaceae bacterium]